jgi:hypothetical protein
MKAKKENRKFYKAKHLKTGGVSLFFVSIKGQCKNLLFIKGGTSYEKN